MKKATAAVALTAVLALSAVAFTACDSSDAPNHFLAKNVSLKAPTALTELTALQDYSLFTPTNHTKNKAENVVLLTKTNAGLNSYVLYDLAGKSVIQTYISSATNQVQVELDCVYGKDWATPYVVVYNTAIDGSVSSYGAALYGIKGSSLTAAVAQISGETAPVEVKRGGDLVLFGGSYFRVGRIRASSFSTSRISSPPLTSKTSTTSRKRRIIRQSAAPIRPRALWCTTTSCSP